MMRGIAYRPGNTKTQIGFVALLAAVGANVLLFGTMSLLNARAVERPKLLEVRPLSPFAPRITRPALDAPQERARRERPRRPKRAPLRMPRPERRVVPPQPQPVAMRRLPMAIDLLRLGDIAAEAVALEVVNSGPPVETVEAAVLPPAPPEPARTYAPEEVSVPPRRVRYVKPLFPPAARRLSRSGAVTVSLLVNREGEVEDIQLVESTGGGLFDQAAMTAVRAWVFEPGRLDGKAVPVRCRVTLRFDLR